MGHILKKRLASAGVRALALTCDVQKCSLVPQRLQLSSRTPAPSCKIPRYDAQDSIGTYLHPGLFRIFTTCLFVSARILGGVMSISCNVSIVRKCGATSFLTFVTQTMTGTFSANAIARCSLAIPMRPAFAPIISMTQDGAPDVSP